MLHLLGFFSENINLAKKVPCKSSFLKTTVQSLAEAINMGLDIRYYVNITKEFLLFQFAAHEISCTKPKQPGVFFDFDIYSLIYYQYKKNLYSIMYLYITQCVV